ncbi:hypothetical protein V1509DRAFT_626104 [Lipomyces kononenkoae]
MAATLGWRAPSTFVRGMAVLTRRIVHMFLLVVQCILLRFEIILPCVVVKLFVLTLVYSRGIVLTVSWQLIEIKNRSKQTPFLYAYARAHVGNFPYTI